MPAPTAIPGTTLSFHSGVITTERITLETDHFVCAIGPGIYVPDRLGDWLEALYHALETVSGLSFRTDTYGKISVTCDRDPQHPDNETTTAFAIHTDGVVVSPGDLFVVPGDCLPHELSHVLQYRNCGWDMGTALVEGFAVYNAYRAIQYLEQNDPQLAFTLSGAEHTIYNYSISQEGYAKLYEQPLSYWMENGFPHAANNTYTLGFRLMRYLDAVCGDYSSWITGYETLNSYEAYLRDPSIKNYTSTLAPEQYLAALPNAYGQGVEEGFYPWLRENESFFEMDYYGYHTDRTALRAASVYPRYTAWLNGEVTSNLAYQDLYLSIDEARRYITVYRKDALHDFRFAVMSSAPVTVELYDAGGVLLSTVTAGGGSAGEHSLDGVSYLKLVGSGTLNSLKLLGFGSLD